MKMTTRITALLLALLLTLSLTGCAGSGSTAATTKSATTTRATQQTTDTREKLSVYVLDAGTEPYVIYAESFGKNNKSWLDMEITTFTDPAEMTEQLETELEEGTGPDVILGEVFLNLDMVRLAEEGAFYNMADIIAADESFNDENYYTAVMKGGQFSTHQYIIPLRFSIAAFASTRRALQEAGIDWEYSSTPQVYEQTLNFLQNAQTPQITSWFTVSDIASVMLGTLGIDPARYGTDYTLQDEQVRTVLKLSAEIIRQRNEFAQATSMYGLVNTYFKAAGELPLYYQNLYLTPDILAMAYSGYNSNGKGDDFVLYFPTADDMGGINAQISHYAAVTADAENPQTAWALIRHVIDGYMIGKDQSFSLKRSTTQESVEEMMQNNRVMGDFTFTGLPEEAAEQLLDALDRVTGSTIEQDADAQVLISEASYRLANSPDDFEAILEELDYDLNDYFNG